MDKAPDAFRTISEVADDLNVPQHVLRFWETRFSQIRPMKRSGGRRYYRPDDVDLLRGIRHLLYGEGYTIRGVQRILRSHGVKAVQSVGQGHSLSVVAEAHEPDHDEDQDLQDQQDNRASAVAEPKPAPRRSSIFDLGKTDDGPPIDYAGGRRRAAEEIEASDNVDTEGDAPVRPLPPAAVRASAVRTPANPPAATTSGLTPAEIIRLEGALADLIECRRVLEAVMQES